MPLLTPSPLVARLFAPAELAFSGPEEGNPFREVTLSARFEEGGETITAEGFYDGEGTYRIRFLPLRTGRWSWRTTSSAAALDGLSGVIEVGPAEAGRHGPVRVADRIHFRHADGTRFLAIGTTAYAWNHQGAALEAETLATLAEAPFTKIRMCVFPKHYRYNEVEPEHYPFPLVERGSSAWPAPEGGSGWRFDFDRFEPAFFRHLEDCIEKLAAIGVEADLILFHPYDRWGFARMSADEDDRYLRYLLARLSAYPNIWWSMANEYDFMYSKTAEDWDRFIGIVKANDPFGHLVSVHNGFPFYDHTDPRLTHASIQRPDPGQGPLWLERYGKPVSVDECCYEGDIAEAWGNISGRELVHRFWSGFANGVSVTHGETFANPTDTVFWAKGGWLIGESVPRIAFLKRILKDGPDEGFDPLPSSGHYQIMAAGGLDHADLRKLLAPFPGEEAWPRVPLHFATAGQPHRLYLTYFGENQPTEFVAPVPPGEHYSATLIDTWDMTERVIAAEVTRGTVLTIPAKPYQALLLRRTDDRGGSS